MKAMLFAAGLGTRLKPITNDIPKALVQLNGKTLLQLAIEKLVHHGFDDIIINVHHFSDKIIKKAEDLSHLAKLSISNESEEVLETGGGLQKAAPFFDNNEPFLVFNVDIITDINLTDLYQHHQEMGGIATVASIEKKSARHFKFNKENILCGWGNNDTGEEILSREDSPLHQRGFCGIHILEPRIFEFMNTEGPYSITPFYLNLAKTEQIYGYDVGKPYWSDVGSHERLAITEKDLSNNNNLYL